MPTLKDEAICLRLLDWSETSQIAVLLTREHGKISATAKGAKRQTPSTLAKFSGGLELLNLGEAVLIVKQTADLANLIEWDLSNGFWRLRRDLFSYRIAMLAADLVHHLVQDHDAHPRTFDALRSLLFAIGTDYADLNDQQSLAHLLQFQWDLITDVGYRPDLSAQPSEEAEAERHRFSPPAGGLVGSQVRDAWPVSANTVSLLRRLEAGHDWQPGAEPDAVTRANRLLCAYIRTILDRQLATMDLILAPHPQAGP